MERSQSWGKNQGGAGQHSHKSKSPDSGILRSQDGRRHADDSETRRDDQAKRAQSPIWNLFFLHDFRSESVEFEFLSPVTIPGERFLFFFVENAVFKDENVHFSSHKTNVCVLRRADDGLPPNIERRIDKDATARL